MAAASAAARRSTAGRSLASFALRPPAVAPNRTDTSTARGRSVGMKPSRGFSVRAAQGGAVGRSTARVTGQRMRIPLPERLKDPANIGACAEGSISLPDAGPGEGHLENYMRLPVEQYVVLDGANIERLGGNTFLLSVPRMQYPFDVWIEPELQVSVDLEEQPGKHAKVVMKSYSCKVKGSQWIEDMNINGRFDMGFRAELKWQANHSPGGGPAKLMCKTGLEVYCETLAPFSVLPRPALESACNAVLNTFTPAIVNLFLTKLAEDYVKWSMDAAYREARRAKSKETMTASA